MPVCLIALVVCPPLSQRSNMTPMRILVVEDDPDLGRQLAEALEQAGYAVDLAPDAVERIRQCREGLQGRCEATARTVSKPIESWTT